MPASAFLAKHSSVVPGALVAAVREAVGAVVLQRQSELQLHAAPSTLLLTLPPSIGENETQPQFHQRSPKSTEYPAATAAAAAAATPWYSGLDAWDVGVAFVTIDDISELNATYRGGRASPTDILSFPYLVCNVAMKMMMKDDEGL